MRTSREALRGGALRAILYFLLACILLSAWGVYACTKKVVGIVGDGVSGVQRRFDGEWDAEERAKDPARYLRFLVDRLEKNLRELQSSAGRAEDDRRRLQALADENRAKSATAAQRLDLLKARYRAVQENQTTYPVDFEGEPLDEAALKTRVGSLLANRDRYGQAAASLERAVAAIDAARRALPEQVEETKAKIAVLVAEEEILRAGKAGENLRRVLDEAGALIAKNDAAVSTDVVRTVEEAMRDAGIGAAASASAGVDDWLRKR
jgi:phage shock protein A